VFADNDTSVEITAADNGGSGVKGIQYYESASAISETDIKNQTDWIDYTSALTFTPADADELVIYAKISDNAGNVTYLSSDGLVFDLQGPVISADYTIGAGAVGVTVTDSGSGVDSVTYAINGGSVQTAAPDSNGSFTVSPLADGRYAVVINASDKVGNTSSYTVNIISLHTVTFRLFEGDTGSALKTEAVEYGNSATAPVNPTRQGFTFKGWDKEYGNITSDITVNGTWEISDITVTPYTGIYDGIPHDGAEVTGTLTGDDRVPRR
jgi:hypothetical protein